MTKKAYSNKPNIFFMMFFWLVAILCVAGIVYCFLFFREIQITRICSKRVSEIMIGRENRCIPFEELSLEDKKKAEKRGLDGQESCIFTSFLESLKCEEKEGIF